VYNFRLGAENVRVTPPEDAVKEEFFAKAMSVPDLKLVVILGHAEIDSSTGIY
jgi:hypothetical protein